MSSEEQNQLNTEQQETLGETPETPKTLPQPKFSEFLDIAFDQLKQGALEQHEMLSKSGNEEQVKMYERFLVVRLNLLRLILLRLNAQFVVMWIAGSGIVAFDQLQGALLNDTVNLIKELEPQEGYKKAWEEAQRSGQLVKEMFEELVPKDLEQRDSVQPTSES